MDVSNEEVVFVDIESAGLEFTRPIIQIAAVSVDSRLIELESIELKILFDESDADPASLSKNKYDPTVWHRDAIDGHEAAITFAQFLRRHSTFDMFSRDGKPYCIAQLAGHNAERFDGPFLHAWYRRQRVFCPARYMTLCTKQKALWLFEEDRSLTPPRDFKLGTLCEYFGVRLRKDEAHDALNDVRATFQLYRAMRAHERLLTAKAA
jgi:DNA polymerase III epsilon subunit-like protein